MPCCADTGDQARLHLGYSPDVDGSGYLVLFSGLVGVLVTVSAGFLGAWVQSRREHRKWIRERRFEAFAQINLTIERMNSYEKFVKRDISQETLDELVADTGKTLAELDEATIERLKKAVAEKVGPPRTFAERMADLEKVRVDIEHSMVNMGMLGTEAVTERAQRVIQLLTYDGSAEEVRAAISSMQSAMRDAIGANDRSSS